MDPTYRLKLHSPKTYNRNLMISAIGALVLHLVFGIAIRGCESRAVSVAPPPPTKYVEVELYEPPPPPETPPPPKTRQIKNVKIVQKMEYAIPKVDPKLIETEQVVQMVAPQKPAETNIKVVSSKEASGDTRAAQLLHKEIPTYPRIARKMGIEGTVVLQIIVDEEGNPRSVELHQSSGSEILDEAAVRAGKKCKFVSAMNNGKATESGVLLYYKFILKGEEIVIE
ncbi:MAG: TonB family protein [bacterium]|nr:TonB family protein [bacterium]